MFKRLLLLISYLAVLGVGFAGGIYALPILIAQPAPLPAQIEQVAGAALYRGAFDPNLEASDWLHWGAGEVWLSQDQIAFNGELAPGPDYRLYLSPVAINSAEEFLRHKASLTLVGDVRGFDGFVLPLPTQTDLSAQRSAVVWCESFGQFISATTLQPL